MIVLFFVKSVFTVIPLIYHKTSDFQWQCLRNVFLSKRDKEYLKTWTISKSDGSWYNKLVFHGQFAKQVFNILILFSCLPEKGHKYLDRPSFNLPKLFQIYELFVHVNWLIECNRWYTFRSIDNVAEWYVLMFYMNIMINIAYIDWQPSWCMT